jgi:hypothetical protein
MTQKAKFNCRCLGNERQFSVELKLPLEGINPTKSGLRGLITAEASCMHSII